MFSVKSVFTLALIPALTTVDALLSGETSLFPGGLSDLLPVVAKTEMVLRDCVAIAGMIKRQ